MREAAGVTSSDATQFPRSYSASSGSKLLLGILGFPVGLAGLAGVWYFGTGHEFQNNTQAVLLVGISVGMAILGFWCAIGALLGKIFILTPDELRVPGIFRTAVVRRDDITGYRVLIVQGMSILQIESRKRGNSRTTRTKIGMYFESDPVFTAWFENIPNLDAIDTANSIRDVESDVRLGDSPSERLSAVDRARTMAKTLNIVAFAAVGWAIFYPYPYTAMFVVVAALPWIALWLSWRYGAFSLEDVERNEARPNLSTMLLMPGMALAIRAITDVQLVDATRLIMPTFVGLGVMVVCLASVAPSFRTRAINLVTMSLLLVAYPASTIAMSNTLFDRSQPRSYRLRVIEKRRTTGKSPRQYFLVSGWGSYGHENEVQVPWRLYQQTKPGQDVCIQVHPGALRLEWYSVQSLQGC